MRLSSRCSAVSASLLVWLVPLVSGISVPTGKLTPITPARVTPRPINPRAPAAPAPVVEYSESNPEPPPLHPSYVPATYNYFDTLARHHVYYVPVRYRNFNAISNDVESAQEKYLGQTLGKNIGYKPYKQLALPRAVDWRGRYKQYSNQYNNQVNQYNIQDNQYNRQDSQYSVQSAQQLPQQQSSAASSTAATARPTQVDYTTGKGSYDVTGKGGSKSEYYSKDWSKKTVYPKKVLADPLRKYSHKF